MSEKKQTSLDKFMSKKRKPEEVEEVKVESSKKKVNSTKGKTVAKKAKKVIESDNEEEEKQVAVKELGEFNSNPLNSYEDFVGHLGDWKEPLQTYLSTAHFKSIFNYVKAEYASTKCFPPKELIFNAFKTVPFNEVKVVIVGQDPYIKENEAVGLCFSVPKTTKCPPSLKNIYKSLKADPDVDFTEPKPVHGDLSSWAKQGILMLNAVLTVREGKSFSHKDSGWAKFTNEVIEAINKQKEGIIFLCWGGKAQEICKKVSTVKHHVLKYSHPSPLSQMTQKFEDCRHFSKVNEILKARGDDPIDWNLK